MTYDLIILGGGPAGSAAAVYSARKQLKTAIIASEFSGQSVVSEKIYNWIGTPEISGADLASNLKKHVLYYKGPFLDILEGEKVIEITKPARPRQLTHDSEGGLAHEGAGGEGKVITVKTESGKTYTTLSVLISTGSSRKKLEAINADKYEHKGITYCASCDGPLYDGQDVLVIGGGNAGFETSLQLLAYCKSVTLIHRSKEFRADKITVDKLLENPKFKTIINADILRVDGDNFVKSLTYKNKETGKEHTIETAGIFVEIGQIPNTGFVKDLVQLDNIGKIIVDPTTQMSSTPGIWAAGDCSNGKYHQNSIAVGDGVKAIEDLYIWVQKNK